MPWIVTYVYSISKLLYFVSRAAPLASITIRNLVLYTTNESWKVRFASMM
jgi:hypothetical protein